MILVRASVHREWTREFWPLPYCPPLKYGEHLSGMRRRTED